MTTTTAACDFAKSSSSCPSFNNNPNRGAWDPESASPAEGSCTKILLSALCKEMAWGPARRILCRSSRSDSLQQRETRLFYDGMSSSCIRHSYIMFLTDYLLETSITPPNLTRLVSREKKCFSGNLLSELLLRKKTEYRLANIQKNSWIFSLPAQIQLFGRLSVKRAIRQEEDLVVGQVNLQPGVRDSCSKGVVIDDFEAIESEIQSI